MSIINSPTCSNVKSLLGKTSR